MAHLVDYQCKGGLHNIHSTSSITSGSRRNCSFFIIFFSNRLKECCERLMFHDPIEYGRKAEELLWRKVFYDVIQTMKQFKKVTNISAHTSLSCYVVCKRYILTII